MLNWLKSIFGIYPHYEVYPDGVFYVKNKHEYYRLKPEE